MSNAVPDVYRFVRRALITRRLPIFLYGVYTPTPALLAILATRRAQTIAPGSITVTARLGHRLGDT